MWTLEYLIQSQFDIELENTYAITDYLGNLAPHQASVFEISVQLLPFSLHIPIIALPARSQSLYVRQFFRKEMCTNLNGVLSHFTLKAFFESQ